MLSKIYSAKRHNEVGFTLLELLIVVIVIGVLAAIALPIFLNQQRAAIDASVQSDVRNSVAQLTGAQAVKETNFKVTVSRAGTTLALVDSTDTTKNGSVTQGATVETLNTPTAGDTFTLSGYNAAGGKFQGPSVEGGKAFNYDGATGKFSTGFDAVTAAGPVAIAQAKFEGSGDTITFTDTRRPHSFDLTSDAAYAGSKGLEMHKDAYGSPAFVDLNFPAGTLEVGKQYRLVFWARGHSDIFVTIHAREENNFTDERGEDVYPRTDWRQFSITFRHVAGAGPVFFENYNVGDVTQIDNVQLFATGK